MYNGKSAQSNIIFISLFVQGWLWHTKTVLFVHIIWVQHAFQMLFFWFCCMTNETKQSHVSLSSLTLFLSSHDYSDPRDDCSSNVGAPGLLKRHIWFQLSPENLRSELNAISGGGDMKTELFKTQAFWRRNLILWEESVCLLLFLS